MWWREGKDDLHQEHREEREAIGREHSKGEERREIQEMIMEGEEKTGQGKRKMKIGEIKEGRRSEEEEG